jgi:hypothetical protein
MAQRGRTAGRSDSAPACTSRTFNYIDLFVRGGDGALYTKWWDGSS